MLDTLLSALPILVAPFILIVWSLVSAYVFRLGFRGSGIGLDYFIFTLIMVVALKFGGVI